MEPIKLTSKEAWKIKTLHTRLQNSSAFLTEALDSYNDAALKGRTQVEAALSEYVSIVCSVKDFVSSTIERMSETVDGRTEDWIESDAGMASQDLIEEWRAFLESTSEYLNPEIEFPDEISLPEMLDQNLSLFDLPQEAEM